MPFLPTVLIIEDNPNHQMVLDVALNERSWPFHVASTGPEGIELARRVKPNVILVDIALGDATGGFGMISALKTNPATKNIPIVVLSAAQHQRARALKVGADDVWFKPYDPFQLLDDLIDFLYQY